MLSRHLAPPYRRSPAAQQFRRMIATVTTTVDTGSFLVIVLTAALASVSSRSWPRALVLPVVVVELMLGIVIGPQVLGLANDDFIEFFSNLGLGMLFFFAGYEIDFERIQGRPLELGALGLAALAGARLRRSAASSPRPASSLSFLYTGSAMATTAIGTLIPILRDSGELRTRFGTYLLAAGAVGEFGPILLVTLVLSTDPPAARGR